MAVISGLNLVSMPAVWCLNSECSLSSQVWGHRSIQLFLLWLFFFFIRFSFYYSGLHAAIFMQVYNGLSGSFQEPLFLASLAFFIIPSQYSPLIPRLSCFPLHVMSTYMIFMHQHETQNPQMRENMWYLFKFDLILWMITSSYIYFPALDITSFLAIPERIHCVTDSHLPFVSSVNRQLGWFHSLAATVIDATVNVYTEAWSQRIRDTTSLSIALFSWDAKPF